MNDTIKCKYHIIFIILLISKPYCVRDRGGGTSLFWITDYDTRLRQSRYIIYHLQSLYDLASKVILSPTDFNIISTEKRNKEYIS